MMIILKLISTTMILVIKQHKTLINVLVVTSLKFALHLCFGIYVMLYALGFGLCHKHLVVLKYLPHDMKNRQYIMAVWYALLLSISAQDDCDCLKSVATSYFCISFLVSLVKLAMAALPPSSRP